MRYSLKDIQKQAEIDKVKSTFIKSFPYDQDTQGNGSVVHLKFWKRTVLRESESCVDGNNKIMSKEKIVKSIQEFSSMIAPVSGESELDIYS